jgi:phosphoenolpyruvate carboxykinase (ATP)
MADTATPSVQLPGLSNVLRTPYYNLPGAALVEEALKRHEGLLTADGALSADTGHFTGRSPQDKFIVNDALTEQTVAWGAINQPISEAHFAALKRDMLAALANTTPFVQDLYAGTDPAYRLNVVA